MRWLLLFAIAAWVVAVAVIAMLVMMGINGDDRGDFE